MYIDKRYKDPKNTYEVAMNDVYETAQEFKTFAGLEPIAHNLEVIYRALSYEQQQLLSDNFYQLFYLTDDEKF